LDEDEFEELGVEAGDEAGLFGLALEVCFCAGGFLGDGVKGSLR
jgi:hypothetical protein